MMHPSTNLVLSPLRAAGVVLGIAFAATFVDVPPAPAATATPQLSISLDNGRTSVVTGDKISYTVTVRNLDTADVLGLSVTQSAPTGLKIESADSNAEVRPGGVDWTADLKGHGQAVFHSTMTVGETPAELLRLASVACAVLSADTPPVVCASHSDQLPAGASAERTRAAMAAESTSGGVLNWWYAAGGACLLAAALVTLVLRRRSAHKPR